MNWIKKHPVICGVIVFNLILIGIVIFILINQSSKTALLDVLVTPSDSKITLNGQEVKNFETQKFTPGEYTAKIEKDGLETKEIKLNLVENQTTKLYTYLTGVNNDFNYYISNSNDEEILERINDENSKDFIKWLSIRKKLPIKDKKYTQEYSQGIFLGNDYMYDILSIEDGSQLPECNNNFCILIRNNTEKRYSEAKEIIQKNGYNPESYHIIYTKEIK